MWSYDAEGRWILDMREFSRATHAKWKAVARVGRLLPRNSSPSRCLHALATRLGIHVEGLMLDCARSGKDWEAEIRREIGEQLILMQPEMWYAVGPGRPSKAKNKQIKPASKEAARVRRHRQKKIVTNI
jgi:hypothetical protein